MLVSGKGHGNPLQYSFLGNFMDRGAWWAIVHGVAKSWTQLSDEHFPFHLEASGYHIGQPGFEVSGRIKARKAAGAHQALVSCVTRRRNL